MENINNLKDKKLQQILVDTKIEAGQNLKYRVMQQIETEVALAHRKGMESSYSIRSIVVLLCFICAILSGSVLISYLWGSGKEKLFVDSDLYLYYILPVCSILSFLACIFALDIKMRKKKHLKRKVSL